MSLGSSSSSPLSLMLDPKREGWGANWGHWLAWPWYCVAWLLGMIYFGVAGVLFTLISPLLAVVLPKKGRADRIRRTIGVLFRLLLRWGQASGILDFDLKALHSLREEKGLILAPNHPMLIDAVLVLGLLPETTCIMKAAIWDSPCLGGAARLAGYIRNDAPASMVKQSMAELAAGRNILVFPEGTRTRPEAGVVNPFKSGFALIAKKSGAPVQLIFIQCSAPYLGKHWPLLKPPPFPLRVKVVLGPRQHIAKDECTHDAVARMESIFRGETVMAKSKEVPV